MKLISTLGTSPGGIFETYVNLMLGNYDAGGENAGRVQIQEIYVIRTNDPDVDFAWKLLKAIFVCCRAEKNGQGQVTLVDIPLNVNDINSRSDFQTFNNAVKNRINVGDYVDVTGGRKSMSVAAALAALSQRAHVVNTIIPQEELNRIQGLVRKLKEKKGEIESLGNKGLTQSTKKECESLGICELVSNKARTILLI
ncbi:MAG: CRISPR-associated ring nuclease Crn1 [Candidatus Aramenus sp.]|jgi:CRISPR-associated protein Csx14|nr:CRISPR-associated ring nuclease Crn1 [Candidatus Aramenus sp.]